MSVIMNRILIINHSDPFAKGGGSYASHAYTKAFAELVDGNIDVCMMAESVFPFDKSIKVNSVIRVPRRSQIIRALSLLTGDIQRYSSFVKRHLRANPNTYDMAVLNGSFEGGALVDICHSYGLKVVTIHHNYDPDYAYDNIRTPIYRNIYRHHVYNLQKNAYKKSDYNLFLTKEDINQCKKEFGTTNGINRLIGVFEFQEIPKLGKKEMVKHPLTFSVTGSLCTVQGVDGLSFFFQELYNYLPQNCKIIVSGRTPTKDVEYLCAIHENVTLIPNPENMSDIISSSDIYICPTRIGGGLKLRVMDGLRLGLPVITHKCSARGYDAFYNHPYFKSFSTPEEFGCAVNEMLMLYDRKEIKKEDVYEKYCKAFSYKSGVERLKKIFEL